MEPAMAVEQTPAAKQALVAPRPAMSNTTRLVLAWWGGAVGSVILWAAVVVAGVLIWMLPEADVNVAAVLIGIGATVAAGLIFGMGVLWYAARVFAKLSFALLALVLVTAGLALMVAAPVVRQMNTPELAEYTGSNALFAFGVTSTLLGLALGALCIRWSMRRRARTVLSRWSRLLGSAYGVLLAVIGIGMLQLFFTLMNNEASVDEFGEPISVVEQAVGFSAIAAMTLLPGIILTYHGISASMGEGSGRFRPPVAALGVLAFGIVLLLGQANMRLESPLAAPMPPLHVLAAIIPGITFAALAGRGSLLRGEPVRGLTWRQITLAAAISMSVAIAIAVYVETIGALYAVVLLLVHNGAFESAADSQAVWDTIADADFLLTGNEQFIAGLFTASVLAPLSEEFGKSLGVRFMMRPNATRAQCFLLGAFAGAAFGFLEAMLYGFAAISEDLSFWWAIMLIRGGSTSLHVICSGLAGVGWWYWSRAKRHRIAVALFGAAVLIHAAWNAFATVLGSRIFGLDTIDSVLLDVVAYGIIAAFSLAMIAAIPIVARRLREHVAPVEGTPLESMAPWLG
ncbi:MAG: PrsW family glutamic-type intramembrane protease [Dehalococcoidia bacterium]